MFICFDFTRLNFFFRVLVKSILSSLFIFEQMFSQMIIFYVLYRAVKMEWIGRMNTTAALLEGGSDTAGTGELVSFNFLKN